MQKVDSSYLGFNVSSTDQRNVGDRDFADQYDGKEDLRLIW